MDVHTLAVCRPSLILILALGVRVPLGSLELARLWSISCDNDTILSDRRIDSKSVMDRNLEIVKEEMNETTLEEQDKLTKDKRYGTGPHGRSGSQ